MMAATGLQVLRVGLLGARHRHLVPRLFSRSLSRRAVATSTTSPPFVLGPLPPSPSSVVPRRCLSSDVPEHVRVALPALSPTMERGTIVSWEKKEGDALAEGDLLCEIETDKATMGFETPEEGFLAKIVLPAGSKDVKIGKLLCIIVSNEEDVEKFKNFEVTDEDDPSDANVESVEKSSQSKEQAQQSPPSQAAVSSQPPPPTIRSVGTSAPSSSPSPSSRPQSAVDGSFRPFASPAAKRLALERGVDLALVASGSGMDGMITTRDVESFVPSAQTVASSVPSVGRPLAGFGDVELSSMRKTIAQRLQASKLEIPHYYLTVECHLDKLLELRSEFNAESEKEGIKLSVNDFIVKATALASRKVPACNSAWMDTFIREYHSCDVSVAVDTGNGLITPIVTEVEKKGLAEISVSIKEMAVRAKEGKLQPHEYQGGTITVSNLGMFGIEHFTAIINPPQSCILAVGGITKRVVADKSEKNVSVEQVLKVTLSCDHRVVDGAVGAQWLQHFKKFIEKPQSMLL